MTFQLARTVVIHSYTEFHGLEWSDCKSYLQVETAFSKCYGPLYIETSAYKVIHQKVNTVSLRL